PLQILLKNFPLLHRTSCTSTLDNYRRHYRHNCNFPPFL
ncbi:unnamed protein product, partial [Arabidopsis halleri]